MHPNPNFRNTSDEQSWQLVSQTSFGILVQSCNRLPVISHIPFLLSTCKSFIELHLVRSNPMARADVAEKVPSTLIVNGPDGYISPDWYGMDDQVPTWNYVAVHLTGHLVRLDDDAIEPLLVRLSEHFEKQLYPKPIWTMDKMTENVKIKMMRQIIPFRFEIAELHSTWKLGQNKPEQARLSAADAVSNHAPLLSQLMKNLPQ